MNKLLPLCLLAVFTTVPLKAQLPPTTAQETPRKEWFGDIFIGYSFRMGRPDLSIVNRFGSRSGFKLGADINRIIKNRPVALGIQAEWTTYSMTSRISSTETAKTRIHTIYIAPALTFLQPLRNGGTLYEEITIGYVNYNELMRDIDVAGFKNLRGHADTWGVKLSFGYHIKGWDFRYSLFSSSVSNLSIRSGGRKLGYTQLDTPLSLASMSLSVGLRF